MTAAIIGIFGVLGLTWAVASIANAYQKRQREENDPLIPLEEDAVEACKLHVWKQVTLLTPEEATAFAMDPGSFKGQSVPYCDSCGYLPSRHMQVSPKYREALRKQEAYVAEVERKTKEVEVLAEEFYQAVLKQYLYGEEELRAFKEGYKAYATFVGILPELLERKRLQQIFEKIKNS